MEDIEITTEEVKEKFREVRNRIIDKLDEPIFPKGTKKKPLIKTGLGKPIKKKVNIGRATKALRQLI